MRFPKGADLCFRSLWGDIFPFGWQVLGFLH